MNFKDFLFQNLCEDQDKEAFKRNAYKRVFPDGKETDTDKMWSSVLSKANYKLTKNSKKETRTAVGIAKGAQSQARAMGIEADAEGTEVPIDDQLTGHLENWDDKDIADLKQNTDIEALKDCNTIDDLKNVINGADDDTKNKILDAIENTEEDVDEIEWKDDNSDGAEADNGEDDTEDADSTEDTENSPEEPEVPEFFAPTAPTAPAAPTDSNTDTLAKIQETQKQEALERKIRDNNIPVTDDGSPDFSKDETFEKINELMINGDDDLFNAYITTQGIEKSDLVRETQARIEKEESIRRTELENREARYRTEKETKSVLAGTAVVLDTLITIFTGEEEKGFETLVAKRTQAKSIEHALEDQFKNALGDKMKQQDENHAIELDNIETHAKFRLEQAEAMKSDPLQTNAYKHKYMELTRKYNEKKQELSEKAPEVQGKLELRNKLESVLFKHSTSGTLGDDLEAVKSVIPQNEGESDEDYMQRLNSDETVAQLEEIKDSVASEVEDFNLSKEHLEEKLQSDIEALKNDPDVLSELKNANARYEFMKADIKAEAERLKAKENKRYEDFKRVNKQIEQDIPRFCKNMSTLSVWASDPETVQCSEIAQRNARIKSMYGLIGQEWDETENPTTLEGVKKSMEAKRDEIDERSRESRSKSGSKSKSKSHGYGYDDWDDDDDDYGFSYGSQTKLLQQQKKQQTVKKDILKDPKNINTENLKLLGLSQDDIPKNLKNGNKKVTDIDGYVEYLKDPKNAEELKTVLDDLDTKNAEKTKKAKEAQKAKEKAKRTEKPAPRKADIDVDSEDFDDDDMNNAKEVKPKKTDSGSPKQQKDVDVNSNKDADVNAKEIDDNPDDDKINTRYNDDVLKGVKVSDTKVKVTKDNFRKYKNNPEVLKAFSKGQNDVIDVEDNKDKDTTKLSGLSLKTLWEKLNKAGISIRTLPGYDQDMDEDEKKNLIIDYMKKHRPFFDGVLPNVSESRRLFADLNKSVKPQMRLREQRLFKSFSSLLRSDFNEFT